MGMSRRIGTILGGVALAACLSAAERASAAGTGAAAAAAATDVSAQARRALRRPRTRIVVRRAATRVDVYPYPSQVRRDCVPVFRERWIPQWGGLVLNAGQSCRWVVVP